MKSQSSTLVFAFKRKKGGKTERTVWLDDSVKHRCLHSEKKLLKSSVKPDLYESESKCVLVTFVGIQTTSQFRLEGFRQQTS